MKKAKVTVLVKNHSAAKKLQKLMDAVRRKDAALQRKFAKDPNHKHVREETGTFGPVGGTRQCVLYWCRDCHADMGHKIRRVKGNKRLAILAGNA